MSHSRCVYFIMVRAGRDNNIRINPLKLSDQKHMAYLSDDGRIERFHGVCCSIRPLRNGGVSAFIDQDKMAFHRQEFDQCLCTGRMEQRILCQSCDKNDMMGTMMWPTMGATLQLRGRQGSYLFAVYRVSAECLRGSTG